MKLNKTIALAAFLVTWHVEQKVPRLCSKEEIHQLNNARPFTLYVTGAECWSQVSKDMNHRCENEQELSEFLAVKPTPSDEESFQGKISNVKIQRY